MSCSFSRRRSVWSSNTRTAQRGGPEAGEEGSAHRARGADRGSAEPGAGGWRVAGQIRPPPPGLFAYVPGEGEGPAAQRELEQGVVGARWNGVRVVGPRQPV